MSRLLRPGAKPHISCWGRRGLGGRGEAEALTRAARRVGVPPGGRNPASAPGPGASLLRVQFPRAPKAVRLEDMEQGGHPPCPPPGMDRQVVLSGESDEGPQPEEEHRTRGRPEGAGPRFAAARLQAGPARAWGSPCGLLPRGAGWTGAALTPGGRTGQDVPAPPRPAAGARGGRKC